MDLYEDLKYRVDLITDTEIPDEASSILKIPEFKEFIETRKHNKKFRHRVVQYVGLMYDPKSPFPAEYRELEKRKEAVAKHCDFTTWGTGYRAEYANFMDLNSTSSKVLILAFLKNIHYSVWSEIQTTEQELWEITELRWEKITTKEIKTSKAKGEEEARTYSADVADKDIFEATNKKEKLMAASKKRREYLKELYEEMFADNADAKAIARDYPISPENAWELV
jgi:hypothetical protein